MLLAVDIGNTNIVVGCFEADKLVAEIRLRTELGRTQDEYAILLCSLLQQRIKGNFHCSAAVVSSVVPPLTLPFCALIEMEYGVKPLIVSSELDVGFNIKIAEPSTLGADRIADVVGAKFYYGLPSMVIDFGTATTIDYIDKDSNYLGGTISPGLNISLDALVSRTAKLPRIEHVFPDHVICNDTVTAMQAGTMIGYECLISGLIDRIEKETNQKVPYIIATGGLGRVIAERLQTQKIIYDADLTLKGILQLWKLNS